MKKHEDDTHLKRLIALVLACVLIFGVATARLFDYQIIKGKEYLESAEKSSSSTVRISAARGEIVDRNGVPLTQNRISYDVVFEYAYTDEKTLNDTIYKLILTFNHFKHEWNDSLPISVTSPYTFNKDADADVEMLKKKLKVNTYATADNCMTWLYRNYGIKKYKDEDGKCTHCGLDYDKCTFKGYSEDMSRKIAGVRYGMLLNDFSKYNSEYIFAKDISSDMVAFLKERASDYEGVQIAQKAVRTYVSGDVASQLLGRVGSIPASDWNGKIYNKKNGYHITDQVGISGLEFALESELRGTDGEKQIIINKAGTVTGENISKQAVKGKTVQLNLDYYFQKDVQKVVSDWIAAYNSGKKESEQIKEGAVAILNPKTGGVLASVSYPYYDINDLVNNYSSVANAPNSPMNNRPINGLYRPGSTFKPVVGTAGLMEGVINTSSTVYCGHVYTFFSDYQPTCLNSGHRNIALNVTKALQYSCNIFFYDVGRRLGINKVDEYAKKFGLGIDTGLEINAQTGHLSSPQYSESVGKDWNVGDILQASIGQMDTYVTPMQMASEAMTLSNRGTRYETHLVKGYIDTNGNITEKPAVVASKLDIDEKYFAAMTEGMNHVADGLAPKYTLKTLGYNVAVKTGSPQVSSTKSNHAYIAFAPTENADICIASMMVNSLPQSTQMIRGIMEAWTKAKDRQKEIQEYYQGLLKGTVTGPPHFSWDETGALSSSSDENTSSISSSSSALGQSSSSASSTQQSSSSQTTTANPTAYIEQSSRQVREDD